MASPPSISVILVTCDRPALLSDALRSVAAQTRTPLEVRIGDDGESPAQEVVSVPPGLAVAWIRTHSGLAAAARNCAARKASGEVLAFLDDDDLWLPAHLERLAQAFLDPDVELAYTDAAVVRERLAPDGTRVELERRTLARDWDPDMMSTNDWIAPSALAVRRGWFEALAGFDESFRYSEDWDFILRASRRSAPVRVPGVTAEIRLRDAGNASAVFSHERLACLERLAARHDLPELEPRTFWEVAEVLGAPDPAE